MNPKNKENAKNGGNIPAVTDQRLKLVPIGCGNCIECRKKQAREWQVRLQEDIKEYQNGKFITLTFSNRSIKELYIEIKGRAKEKIEKLQNGKVYTQETKKQIQKIKDKTTGY